MNFLMILRRFFVFLLLNYLLLPDLIQSKETDQDKKLFRYSNFRLWKSIYTLKSLREYENWRNGWTAALIFDDRGRF